VSLFASTHDDLADLFDQIPLLATRTGIEDLTGGLTNRNVKVTTPDGVYVARCSDREHNPLGIDNLSFGQQRASSGLINLSGGSPISGFQEKITGAIEMLVRITILAQSEEQEAKVVFNAR